MSAAEKVAPTMEMEALDWVEICRQYPDEWVFLVAVQHDPDGSLRSARVISHHRSMKEALKQCSWSADPVITYAHTAGRTLRRSPRIEMTDEIRDIIRSRR